MSEVNISQYQIHLKCCTMLSNSGMQRNLIRHEASQSSDQLEETDGSVSHTDIAASWISRCCHTHSIPSSAFPV